MSVDAVTAELEDATVLDETAVLLDEAFTELEDAITLDETALLDDAVLLLDVAVRASTLARLGTTGVQPLSTKEG